MNIPTIAVLGSVIASLVAVPAAPALLADPTGAVTALTGEPANGTPHTVEMTRSPDGFHHTVETGQGAATLTGEADRFTMELDRPTATVTVRSSPDSRVQRIVSGPDTLTINRSGGRVVERCETVAGVLTSERHRGTTATSFSGTDRAAVRSRCQVLTHRLEDGASTLAQVAADVGLIDPDLSVTEVDAAMESITLANTGPVRATLDGWTLEDAAGTTYTFTDLSLASGEQVTVYSGDAGNTTVCDPSGGPHHERCWGDQQVWNDGGDTAILRDGDGSEITTHTYP